MRKFSFACLFGLALATAFSAPGSAADVAQGDAAAHGYRRLLLEHMQGVER